MRASGRPERPRRVPTGMRPGVLAGILAGVLLAAGAMAQSGLPTPRFVSLRADEINLRTGPGLGYPVEWVYVRRHMPVEVIAEFDTWRKIRDWQGTVGWVHQSMLDGQRTALVTGEVRMLRRAPQVDAPPVARLSPGVIAVIRECQPRWCRLAADGYEGWLRRDQFWGTYMEEAFE